MIPGADFSWVLTAFIAPIVTGVSVGLALRGAAVFGEVNDHDLAAENLCADLLRWVQDRDFLLARETRAAINSAGARIGDGSTRNELERQMRAALHEYRDEASRAIRAYRVMARSEGLLHRLARRGIVPPPLLIGAQGQLALAGWRNAAPPVPGEEEIQIRPEVDPTQQGNADEIRVLEVDGGLSWNLAGTSIATRDLGYLPTG